MTITYRTVVLHVPPTPLGLLPERWTIEHRCNLCGHLVVADHLVDHARCHDDTKPRFESARGEGNNA